MKAVAEQVLIAPAGSTWSLPATVVLPERLGPVPCIVFFAGSGPTDRDWRSPLLPAGIGSAELLADGLRAQGVGSLRFDKVGSGTNMKPLEVLSLAHYVEEARAAFDLLAARPTDCAAITLAGHSEGSLHMLSAAVALQASPRFGGFVSMAGPSRSILETAIEQIRNAHLKKGELPSKLDPPLEAFRQAMNHAEALAPDFTAVPEAEVFWKITHDPRQARVARELLAADPLAAASSYRGRALVLSAEHDLQVPRSDADRIFAALGSPPSLKKETVIAQANHVFRSEPKSTTELDPASAVPAYTDPARPLAPGLVDALVGFVKQ